MDIGLVPFLADRPFRLGHLEISFGICSRPRIARINADVNAVERLV